MEIYLDYEKTKPFTNYGMDKYGYAILKKGNFFVFGNSKVKVYNRVRILAFNKARVKTYDKTRAWVRDNSEVDAYNYSIVWAKDQVVYRAYDKAKVIY